MVRSIAILYECAKGRSDTELSPKISKELVKHRLEQAKEDLKASKALYDLKLYKSSNNRAYYSIFHSIKAILH